MILTARNGLIAIAAVSALAMLYVGAYQIRAVEHLSCPLLKKGCEAVADAPFARPFGIPDGFLATGIYGAVILITVFGTHAAGWSRYSLRGLALLAAIANGLGTYDMNRLGSWCFYCLLTTALSPLLIWLAFVY
jgi:uncharacterized membrane protein